MLPPKKARGFKLGLLPARAGTPVWLRAVVTSAEYALHCTEPRSNEKKKME